MFTPIPHHLPRASILLINADFAKNELGMSTPHENHLGLNRLAGYLESKNILTQVLNTTGREKGRSGPEELAAWINKEHGRYETFGFYTTSWNISYITRMVRNLGEAVKAKPLFFGGPLPSGAPELVLQHLQSLGLRNIGLAQGYGEFVLEKMIRQSDDLSAIAGVWSFQYGKLTKGSLQRFTEKEMASLPLLNNDYNTFYQLYYKPCLQKNDLGVYSIELIYGSLGLDSNHGCAFNCSYCSVPAFGRKVTSYTPKRVVDEIEHTAKETGIFMFTFTNSNVMFYSREWIRNFCHELLNRKMQQYITWTGYQHINILDQLDEADFRLIKEAGCDDIVIGVQSIEATVCELFNRPKDTFEKVQRLVRTLRATDQRLVIDYITSVPGENSEAIVNFYQFCQKHEIECRNFDLKLYPGAEIMQKGMDLTNFDIVPVTGDLAQNLETYVLMKKDPDHALTRAQTELHTYNHELNRKKPVRLGKWQIKTPHFAERLLKYDIPKNEAIPERVKQAMLLLLTEMLHPQEKTENLEHCSLEEMLKQVIQAGDDAPPVIREMKERMKREMGEEKFARVLRRCSS